MEIQRSQVQEEEKKERQFNTKQRCLRGEQSTRCNWSFKGTSRRCSRKRPWNKRPASEMRKVFRDRSSWKETHSNMNTSLRQVLSSRRFRKSLGYRESSQRRTNTLSRKCSRIPRRRRGRHRSRRWHQCSTWFQAAWVKSCQILKSLQKLRIWHSVYLVLIT